MCTLRGTVGVLSTRGVIGKTHYLSSVIPRMSPLNVGLDSTFNHTYLGSFHIVLYIYIVIYIPKLWCAMVQSLYLRALFIVDKSRAPCRHVWARCALIIYEYS